MTFSPKAIEAAARALRERDMAGRLTIRWECLSSGKKRKWIERGEAAISAALAVDGMALQGWRPIESAPKDTMKVCSETLLLAHANKKWIRFGKWYVQERCWYYSGTNERSKYAQVRGDDPTHWQPLPKPPAASDREERR